MKQYYRIKATPGHKPEPLSPRECTALEASIRRSPARQHLDEVIARHERKAAVATRPAPLRGFASTPVLPRFRAATSPARLKEALDKERERLLLDEGGSPADRAARQARLDRARSAESTKISRFASKNRVSISEARRALGLGGGR